MVTNDEQKHRNRLARGLKRRLRELGLTPADLCRRLDVGPSKVSRIINATHSTSSYFVSRIAAALQTTSSELVGEEVPVEA